MRRHIFIGPVLILVLLLLAGCQPSKQQQIDPQKLTAQVSEKYGLDFSFVAAVGGSIGSPAYQISMVSDALPGARLIASFRDGFQVLDGDNVTAYLMQDQVQARFDALIPEVYENSRCISIPTANPQKLSVDYPMTIQEYMADPGASVHVYIFTAGDPAAREQDAVALLNLLKKEDISTAATLSYVNAGMLPEITADTYEKYLILSNCVVRGEIRMGSDGKETTVSWENGTLKPAGV